VVHYSMIKSRQNIAIIFLTEKQATGQSKVVQKYNIWLAEQVAERGTRST
jgi:hypothetical protein